MRVYSMWNDDLLGDFGGSFESTLMNETQS